MNKYMGGFGGIHFNHLISLINHLYLCELSRDSEYVYVVSSNVRPRVSFLGKQRVMRA